LGPKAAGSEKRAKNAIVSKKMMMRWIAICEKNAEKIKKIGQQQEARKISLKALFFFPTGRLLSFLQKKKRKKKIAHTGVRLV